MATLLEDTNPDTVFSARLSVTDAVDVIEDALLNDSLDDFKSLALNIFGLLIDASTIAATSNANGGHHAP
jgi:hypothetical protein